ncbi:MAG: hypothetical protein JWO65_557 [Sphingomonas bacterium]|jgi:hypothetical protein|nr:hypothetical protein [Sphingomonas bacterium]
MIQAQTLGDTTASLSSALVRRRRPLRLAAPVRANLPVLYEAPVVSGWGEDLRFFLTCYAAGFVFFLVMLS